jgi:hypothetical protein
MLVCVDARGRNTCSAAFNRKCLIKSDLAAATGRCKIAFSAAAARTGCRSILHTHALVASRRNLGRSLFLRRFLRSHRPRTRINRGGKMLYFVSSENKMSIVSIQLTLLCAKKFESLLENRCFKFEKIRCQAE